MDARATVGGGASGRSRRWLGTRGVTAPDPRVRHQAARAAVTVASGRLLDFDAALSAVNDAAGTRFRYVRASLPGYVAHARRRGTGWPMILVMLLLHFLPRFSRQQAVAGDVQAVLGRPPEMIEDWARRNRAALRALED